MPGTNNNGVFAMTNGTIFIYEMLQINATGRKQTPVPLPAGKENQCREDPKFVRDACGEPVALMTPAMLSVHSDHSYVLAQPIAHNTCTL